MKPPPTAAESTANQEPILTHFLLREFEVLLSSNKEGQVPKWRVSHAIFSGTECISKSHTVFCSTRVDYILSWEIDWELTFCAAPEITINMAAIAHVCYSGPTQALDSCR